MPTMTYLQAISDAMREEMRADERVFVMGEDIGVFGGAFKVTDGFIEEFGAERVMDTPLAESGDRRHRGRRGGRGHAPDLRDAVRRLHLLRLRPAGQRRRARCTTGRACRVNITVRLPSGGGFSGGPFHSQNPEAWFMHSPGPEGRRAVDGRGRQGPADRGDPRPQPGRVHGAQAPLPPRQGRGAPRASTRRRSRARIAREGTDLTVIAYGAMVHTALEATRGPRRRLDRGARPALARAARRGGDPRVGAQDLEGRDRRRGQPDVRGRRPGRGADRRARLGGPRRPGRARLARPTCRSRSPRRSSRPCCPRSTT